MKICINKLRLFGYHGLKESEKEDGQNFDFYIELVSSSSPKDDIMPIINYEDVMQDVQNIFFKKRYNLLESLINDLVQVLREKYALSYIKIGVEKPNAPIKYDCKSVGVEYRWESNE